MKKKELDYRSYLVEEKEKKRKRQEDYFSQLRK
jgi:hypothetical protein